LRPALALALALLAAPSRALAANPVLADDFRSMTQWLSHELAQGLAFNAGSTFDPPREIKGILLQPDISLGIGKIPFDKRNFPTLTTPALNEQGGANIFPDKVLFPNLALHLRMGLPGRADAYLRFADATTPPGYKISPTMTAEVQTNSYGAGVRRHFFGRHEEEPTLTMGAHYNHVRGRTRLKGKFNVNVDNSFNADSDLTGLLDWNLNSWALTAVGHRSWGAWTPFFGFGYNYASGSVRSRLELKSRTFLINDIIGEGSERPERSQGRWITGLQYAKPTWSFFANAEVKALGKLQYRSWVAQAGFALPYEIGRGPLIIYKKRRTASPPLPEPRRVLEDEPSSEAEPKSRSRRRAAPEAPRPAPKAEQAPPEMIFLQ
jgi:hypothetical protein